MEKNSKKTLFYVKFDLVYGDARLHFIVKRLSRRLFFIEKNNLSNIRKKSAGSLQLRGELAWNDPNGIKQMSQFQLSPFQPKWWYCLQTMIETTWHFLFSIQITIIEVCLCLYVSTLLCHFAGHSIENNGHSEPLKDWYCYKTSWHSIGCCFCRQVTNSFYSEVN